MSRLEARAKHLFSWGFNLHTEEGFLATMDMSWLREGGEFRWQGQIYTLGRESWMTGDFLLQTNGHTEARATKESAFLRKFHIHTDTRELVLRAASPITRAFCLLDKSREVGRISPHHPFTRSSTLELPEDLTVPEQVFLFWLVVLMWRRASGSAD